MSSTTPPEIAQTLPFLVCYPVARAKNPGSSLSSSFSPSRLLFEVCPESGSSQPHPTILPWSLASPLLPLQPCALISAQWPERPVHTPLRSCLSSEGTLQRLPTHSDTQSRIFICCQKTTLISSCHSRLPFLTVLQPHGPLLSQDLCTGWSLCLSCSPLAWPHSSCSRSLQVPGQMSPLSKYLPCSHMR